MVRKVHLLYVPFRYFISGHVCFVFTMENGKRIVISPEAATDNFSLLLGFLPWYRLRYLKISYGQYIRKSKNNKRSISLHQLSLSASQAQKLYEDMNEKVSSLERQKVGYHILFNSCITNSCKHIREFLKAESYIKILLLSPLQPERISVRVNKSL